MLRHLMHPAMTAGFATLLVASAVVPANHALAQTKTARTQALAALPAVPAVMSCALPAFQSLNLAGVADDNGQVSFSAVSLVAASATNPSAYCSVRGVVGRGASSIVMKLPMDNWTQR